MQQCQRDLVDVNLVSENRDWISWIKDIQNPKKSRFKCYQCSLTKPFNKMRDNEYSEMANEEGILYDSYGENNKAIKRHAASKGHQRVKEDIRRFNIGTVLETLADLIAKKGTNHWNEHTNNVMIAVNYEITIHNSFNTHPHTMALLKGFGVKVGNPHCHSVAAAANFLEAQSVTYHRKFLRELTEDIPMTLSMLITTTLAKEEVSHKHKMLLPSDFYHPRGLTGRFVPQQTLDGFLTPTVCKILKFVKTKNQCCLYIFINENLESVFLL